MGTRCGAPRGAGAQKQRSLATTKKRGVGGLGSVRAVEALHEVVPGGPLTSGQDQAGTDRYVTEIVIRPYQGVLQMLDGSSQASHEHDQATRDMGAGADQGHEYADDFAQS